jgi:outer membrane protein assembly factor BamD (BamD/ComL family)
MKTKLIFIGFLSLAMFTSCNRRGHRIENIKKLEASYYNKTNFTIDNKMANDLVNLYIAFAENYPKDTLSPEFFFQASRIAMNINQPQQAISCLEKVCTNYPNFNKTPQSLFIQGFIYDDKLKNFQKAKEIYTLFIEKYPTHELVKDAKASIENLGKSPEELIKSFEEKQVKNSDVTNNQATK